MLLFLLRSVFTFLSESCHMSTLILSLTFMGHVAHNLKISAQQNFFFFFLIFDVETISCTQFIGVFTAIHLTNSYS